jgi:hypothetical protein
MQGHTGSDLADLITEIQALASMSVSRGKSVYLWLSL